MNWSRRDEPLPVRAVVGRGPVAGQLAQRLMGGSWSGVVGDAFVLAVGDDLPWVDGVVYLGADPALPALLFDTRMQPDVPLSWLGQRLPGSWAWLLDPPALVSLAEVAPFSAPALQRWMLR